MSTHMGAAVLAAGIRPRRENPLTSCFAKNGDAITGLETVLPVFERYESETTHDT